MTMTPSTKDVAKLPVQVWDIARLVPSETNSKKHSNEHIAKLAKSIEKHGIANTIQVEPSIFADGEINPTPGKIIAGHGRRLAALKNGWSTVSVIERTDLTRAECVALRIADNQTVSTEYDAELLKQELAELRETDYADMDTLGLDEDELAKLTVDFGDFNDEAFVEDITEAVETQKAQNAEKEKEVDTTAAPVGDALGFKRVTVAQSRQIRVFMTKIEAETGLKGAEALVFFINDSGYLAP